MNLAGLVVGVIGIVSTLFFGIWSARSAKVSKASSVAASEAFLAQHRQWTSTGSAGLSQTWVLKPPPDESPDVINGISGWKDPPNNNEWVNEMTGASMLLRSDGGWRSPKNSRFRVFLDLPGGNRVEMTDTILANAENKGRYLINAKGADTYASVEKSCIAAVETHLGI